MESSLLKGCCGVFVVFVVESCYGRFVVESLSWNLCCGIGVVENVLVLLRNVCCVIFVVE